ncbi:NAD(P)H-binding protein [Streptococcus pantholopis]|uniref:NmrA family transcriptional regulator n=1 Tax=Streptococcus pantholopis TaxID=1811193 RepID=A0A172Q7Q9_9STRE|nr:NAD(P)H-binding protein [Streptococcus pantholopis]AND79488.1 NmrA family transcriptional regulator [Streptococcus pantholopis]
MAKIVVNGVDGNFGSQVAAFVQDLLPKEDLLFTAPAEEALKAYQDAGIATAVLNFNTQDNLVKVFENADKVLLISMPFVGERRRKAHQNVVEACVKANVRQVIYTSVLSAAHPFNPSIENRDHAFTEAIIQNTPLDYIFLRHSLFAEAFISDYLRAAEAKEAAISKNMGDGRVWFISRRDAAFAASCALANDLLHRAVLNINGLEPISYQKFLDIANAATGNTITYTKLTDDELYAYFDSIGVPRDTDGDFSKSPIQATSEGMVSFGTAVTEGFLDVAVSDFVKLTGRQPLSLGQMFENADDYLLGERHTAEGDF